MPIKKKCLLRALAQICLLALLSAKATGEPKATPAGDDTPRAARNAAERVVNTAGDGAGNTTGREELMVVTSAPSTGSLALVATDSLLEMSNGIQKISFAKDTDGKFRPSVHVWNGSSWELFLDGRRPLIEGAIFNLEPTSYGILENSSIRKLVQFHGVSASPPNVWDIGMEMRADSPLAFFQIASHFQSDITLTAPQPTVALWMNQPSADLTLDQGPLSPTGDVYNTPFVYGFPAAYLWHQGREASVFFDMTPMTWMSRQGVGRFQDVQIKIQPQAGQTGLGMFPRHLSGNKLRAGEMLVTFYLYASRRDAKPTKFEALDRMMQVFAPLCRADSVFPSNTLAGGEVSWKSFTQQAVSDFQIRNTTYGDLSVAWDDMPLYLITIGNRMIVHPDRAVASQSQAESAWNFSTVNLHLTPWMLYERLNPNTSAHVFAMVKKQGLPRFYDSVARMVCSGTRQPVHVFTAEISWQSLVFYQKLLEVYEALAPADFNPAITGRMLMGLSGLMQYAANVNYVFSTYFYPGSKQPMDFAENPGLGAIREPWSVGSYAYVLMRAYEMTRNERLRAEAAKALDTFLTTMTYTESNSYFTRTFTESMDMPVMELIGNGYGAVAAFKLYQRSGDPRMLRVSRDFLNTLLRMTIWFEDNTDAVSRELRNTGLFYPFGGAACPTPWETSEANLCMAWMLKNDTANPLTPLLLKLSNLNRINSFYFYPAAYTPTVRALNPSLRRDLGQYCPIEEFYMLEFPGGSTGSNGTAFYMAGNAMWNYWMYEALAQADNRSIMALNLDVLDDYQETLSSAKRRFIVFNPTTGRLSFNFRILGLAEGNYTMICADSAGNSGAPVVYSSAQLTSGVALALDSLDYARVELRHENANAMLAQIGEIRNTRNNLSLAYSLLQERARDQGTDPLANLKTVFQSAMQAYDNGNYSAANDSAVYILVQLGYEFPSRINGWELYD
ncbi:MAG: hypothetical protein WCK47_08195 [bacterium]